MHSAKPCYFRVKLFHNLEVSTVNHSCRTVCNSIWNLSPIGNNLDVTRRKRAFLKMCNTSTAGSGCCVMSHVGMPSFSKFGKNVSPLVPFVLQIKVSITTCNLPLAFEDVIRAG